jgi:glycerol-3-phosphate acyltransferase PlsY
MKPLSILISFLIGFLCGMIPFSYIIAIIRGIDLKKIGSGNIGATNLGRALGLPFFILGFLLDGVKGFLPVMVLKSTELFPAIAGAGAILGHIFNPIFKFKGGKGVSTTIGVILALEPKLFFISLLVWIIIYFITYIVSLASMSMTVTLLVSTFITKQIGLDEKILFWLIGLLVIFAHRDNIKRLIKNTEPKTIFWRRE